MNVFWVLMLVSLAAVPLALALWKVELGGGAPTGHIEADLMMSSAEGLHG
jgi:hypothetical protein